MHWKLLRNSIFAIESCSYAINSKCLWLLLNSYEHSKIYTQDYKTATIFDKELIEWMTISRNQEKGASLVYVFGPYLWAYLDMEYNYHDLLVSEWCQYLPEEAIEMLVDIYGQEAIDNFYPWLREHPEVIEMFNQY